MSVEENMIASLAQRHFELMERTNADRRAHFVAELAAFSFLIEKGLATREEINARLQLVQQTLPPDYRDPQVN
jgi:hypothetical protein